MANVLLIYDDGDATLTTEQVLTTMGISAVRLDFKAFHPEFLLAEVFELIIFELVGESRSSVTILNQLEKLALTSGMQFPPVIVVADDDGGNIEQALRTASVNFYFIKPVDEDELASAIEQSLQQARNAGDTP